MTCANEFQELLHQSIERRSSLQANIVPGMLDGWKKAGIWPDGGCMDGWSDGFYIPFSYLEPRSMVAPQRDNCACHAAAWLSCPLHPPRMLCSSGGGWWAGWPLAQRLPPGPVTRTAGLSFTPFLGSDTPVLTPVSDSSISYRAEST